MQSPELVLIGSHLRWVESVEFELDRDGLASHQIRVNTATGQSVLDVSRDFRVAPEGDVDFISNSIADMRLLFEAASSGEQLSPTDVLAIAGRAASASPGPWRAGIEADGGQGGGDFIQVSDHDDEEDLYLWIGHAPAPSNYFRFVAAARQDIPRLLEIAGSVGQ
jgi:hypothetical protein